MNFPLAAISNGFNAVVPLVLVLLVVVVVVVLGSVLEQVVVVVEDPQSEYALNKVGAIAHADIIIAVQAPSDLPLLLVLLPYRFVCNPNIGSIFDCTINELLRRNLFSNKPNTFSRAK